MTPGMLVNRPDLSDDAVIQAIADHDAADRRSALDAEALLRSAMEGDDDARALLSGLVLPPPAAPLAMHTQTLTREAGSWMPRLAPSAWLRRGAV